MIRILQGMRALLRHRPGSAPHAVEQRQDPGRGGVVPLPAGALQGRQWGRASAEGHTPAYLPTRGGRSLSTYFGPATFENQLVTTPPTPGGGGLGNCT